MLSWVFVFVTVVYRY